MVMGCAGHVCCRGGAMGAVGGLHLLRRQRDRKAAISLQFFAARSVACIARETGAVST